MTVAALVQSKPFEAALQARWTVAWAVVSDKVTTAFVAGAFATPITTKEYFVDNWWVIVVSGLVAFVFGSIGRAVQRSMANGSVPAPVPAQAPPAP
jgi:hypothetical protein